MQYSSGRASIGARVGCVAAAWRWRSVCALLQTQVAAFPGGVGFGRKKGRGRRCVLRPLFEALPGRVVNRGGRVGRKSLPAAGAVQVRGRPFDGAGGHRVDHRIVLAVGRAAFRTSRRSSTKAVASMIVEARP